MVELLKSVLLQDGILSQLDLIKAKAKDVFNTYNLLRVLTKNQIQDFVRFIHRTNNLNEVKIYLENKKKRDKSSASWGKKVNSITLANKIWEIIDNFQTNAEIQAGAATSANPSLGLSPDLFKERFWIQFSRKFANYLLGLYQIEEKEQRHV